MAGNCAYGVYWNAPRVLESCGSTCIWLLGDRGLELDAICDWVVGLDDDYCTCCCWPWAKGFEFGTASADWSWRTALMLPNAIVTPISKRNVIIWVLCFLVTVN